MSISIIVDAYQEVMVIPGRSLCEVSAEVFGSTVNLICPVSLWSYLVAACENG